jgi:nitroimidazol reductase NimA-like FMN-containing flavoprotein (pyridoxamine 5'-phosphate oxidase superfamily)
MSYNKRPLASTRGLSISYRLGDMKEITQDRNVIESIVRQALVCRIAMTDGDQPYIVPVCFGYADNALYFHSSAKGRKVDILKRNGAVCFEFDVDQALVSTKIPCRSSIKYRSVIGFGKAFFVQGPAEKKKALDIIMAQYGGQPPYAYPAATLEKTAIVKIEVESMTAKVAGY